MTFSATLFCDTSDAQALFAGQELLSSLIEHGYRETTISSLNSLSSGAEKFRVIISRKSFLPAQEILNSENGQQVGQLQPQGYAFRKTTLNKRTTYWVIGADSTGTMYGGLDLAQAIKIDDLDSFIDSEYAPFIDQRGIKFNIPLDVRTPGYSDDGSSAWQNVAVMWDFEFWKEFLDDCARYHYNVLSLWNMHPFPSMIKVPEYPDVALDDVQINPGICAHANFSGADMCPENVLRAAITVKKMTIDEKIEYWKKVMEYGRDRGIIFYIFTWNIFTYGADGKHGITTAPGPETTDYFQKSVKTLLLTYPLLAGIGISSGENMQGEGSPWLWKAYGEGVLAAKADPSWPAGRKVRFIHRELLSNVSHILSAFSNYPDTLDFSFKYSQAHMYSSVRPTLLDKWLPSVPQGMKTWLTIRNDDFYMMRWGDPQYAREYLKNIPIASGKIAGFYMGPDGYIWGREFLSTEPQNPRQPVIKKMWYSFMIWGRLAYDNTIPNAKFIKILAYNFPEVNSENLFNAWSLVSNILPLVTRFKWSDSEWDGSWYPESGSRWTDKWQTIDDFIIQSPMDGTNLMSIKEYAANRHGSKTTPIEVAQEIKTWANSALKRVAAMDPGNNTELRLTIGDIRAMATLGNYYAEKILGATCKATGQKKSAIEHMQKAADYWRQYASIIGSQYVPQVLTRIGPTPVDVKALMGNVLDDIALAGGIARQISANSTSGNTMLNAEAAQITNGIFSSSIPGFTGTGYVELYADGTLDWEYKAPVKGKYLIEIRYSIEKGDIPVALSINGSIVDRFLSFWSTDNTWQIESRYVSLIAGINRVGITVSQKGAVVDHINIINNL